MNIRKPTRHPSVASDGTGSGTVTITIPRDDAEYGIAQYVVSAVPVAELAVTDAGNGRTLVRHVAGQYEVRIHESGQTKAQIDAQVADATP